MSIDKVIDSGRKINSSLKMFNEYLCGCTGGLMSSISTSRLVDVSRLDSIFQTSFHSESWQQPTGINEDSLQEETSKLYAGECYQDNDYKVVNFCLVGDPGVGKTQFCRFYSLHTYQEDYPDSRVFDKFETTIHIKKLGNQKKQKPDTVIDIWKLILQDTSGLDDYNFARSMVYGHADVVLVCFSVISRYTFTNIKEKWLPELRKRGVRNDKIVLIGMHRDERPKDGSLRSKCLKGNVVSTEEVKNFAEEEKLTWFECSNYVRTDILEIMDQVFVKSLQTV